jgi:hypothetical protein
VCHERILIYLLNNNAFERIIQAHRPVHSVVETAGEVMQNLNGEKSAS